MYSTVEGARRFAKKLQRFLRSAGVAANLSLCQNVTARAGGFSSWHELNATNGLGGSGMPPASEFRLRLASALPERAREAVLEWLARPATQPPAEAWPQASAVDSWLREVLPYALAILGQHRTHTKLFRRGSGHGLNLRLEILDALTIGGLFPDLDAASLELSVPMEAVGRSPRRVDPLQLEVLAAAGVITLLPDRLVLHPVDALDLEARMARWHASISSSRRLEVES